MSKNNRARPGTGTRYDRWSPNEADAIRHAPPTNTVRIRVGFRLCGKCKQVTPVKGGSITNGGYRFRCAQCRSPA